MSLAPTRTVTVYRGIPFAAPPVGDLRWRAPQAAAPWTGVRRADRFSAGCMQNPLGSLGPWTEEFMHQGERSEDCLYLNVWTTSPQGRRPVFVWIHGGAFEQGSTAVALYDGEALARQGVVVVSANYRLREFGFLAHPELTKESGHEASGNYGLMDLVAALKWVQANIAAFGGDPSRVTIGGQSAGAAAVMSLTTSPLARGLFHQAIVQSGVSVANRWRARAAAEADGEKFLAAKGARSLREMRALPADQVMAAVDQLTYRAGPIVDGWVIPEPPLEVYAAGRQHDVAILTGWTADEGSSNPTYGRRTPEEFQKEVRGRLGPANTTSPLPDQFFRLYPASTPEQAGASQKLSAREQSLVSTFLWAKRRATSAKTPCYTYLWTHPMPGPEKSTYGAFHSSELAYVFNSLGSARRPWEPADRAIGEKTSAYWANFVRTGNPNGAGLPEWPVFDPARAVTMEIGDAFGPRPVATPEKVTLFEALLSAAAGAPGR